MTDEMRRRDREKTEAFARETAEAADWATLSTANEAGEPYGVAVSPVIEGNVIYFHGAKEAGRKFRNMEANPHVSLLFVSRAKVLSADFACDYRSAIFEGDVTRVSDPVERLHAFWKIAERYSGRESVDTRREYMERFAAAADIWRVDVKKISAKARS